MGMIGLLGIFAKRPAQSVSALSAAVIVLILLDPYRATSYGFALSCAATMGIVLSAKPIEFRLERLLPETLAALLAVPIAAAVWTSPILVLMTGKFNLLTVPANIIAVPFIEGATIFGLLSTVLSFCAVVSVPLAWVGTLFAQGIVFDANAIASLPLASVYWIQGVVGALILVGIFLALAFSGRVYRFVYTKVRGYEPSEADTLVYRLRRKAGSVFSGVGGLFKVTPIVLACCIVIALAPPATLLTVNSLENGKPPADWVIAACKVGQGDANLIHTSAHSAIVVDVGPSPENMGKCIKEFGIEKIDLLVLTHFHSDHVDGLSEVAGKVPIAQAFVSKVQPNTKEVKTTLSLLKSNNIPTSTPKEGESGTIDGDVDSVKWEVVSALGAPSGVKLSGLSAAKLDDAENDSSVSLFVKITPRLGGTGAGSEGSAGAGNAPGAQSAGSAGEAEGAPNAGAAEPANHEITGLFLGDLELEGQQNLLKAVKREHISDVDVLKVAHHGSKTQNKVLAEIVHPRVAIYDVGHNTFGHPNKQTVSMFEQMGALSLKTLDSSVGVYIDKNGELEGFR
jgi:competence protein ComEC